MKCRLVFLAGLVACSTPAYADTASDHQNMLNAHGAQVMPFDMKTAMHMFTLNATGGTVEIMVRDMDTQQIALVRQHLSAEAAKFATGNYSDPAYIHGSSMPGLQVLAANSTTISVRYSDTRMGRQD